MTRDQFADAGETDSPRTFLGVPARPLGDLRAQVVFAGARHAVAYPGAEHHAADAPAALRAASERVARFLGHWDFDLGAPMELIGAVDAGDVETYAADPDGNRRRITQAVRSIRAQGAVPIVIGGDDSVPAPVIAAYEGGTELTVLHLDAHLDFRDDVEGERHGYSSGMRRASAMPWVRRIIHVGLRGVGSARPEDVTASLDAGNAIVTAAAVERDGIAAAVDLLEPDEPYFVSFDADVFEPSVMAAVRAPAPGGLGYRQLLEILRGARGRGAFQGMILTEYAPALDDHDRSALTLVRLLASVLSHAAVAPTTD